MSKTSYDIDDLLYLMARLRDPVSGCPWDCQQDYKSLVSYTVEEVYEVVDAVERDDFAHLNEELGDLLFQVVFFARIAEQQGHFDFAAVVDGIVRKLLARHPHVFPDGSLASRRGADVVAVEEQISEQWESIKQQERHNKGHDWLLADIPTALPALMRAQKIQKRVAKVGFDWDSIDGVMAKTREEFTELEEALSRADQGAVADELGDLLFCCVNLARHAGCDAETLLRRATLKFETRFKQLVKLAAAREGSLADFDAAGLDALWREVKSSDPSQR